MMTFYYHLLRSISPQLRPNGNINGFGGFATAAASIHSHRVDAVNMVSNRSTIFALSSAFGKAGVAIVRISGPKAEWCLSTLLGPSGRPVKPRVASLRRIYTPLNGEPLDDALVLFFPGPRSFTGEDVVELHVHGGKAVVKDTLAALDTIAPSNQLIRLAAPGEFTRRAFDNGRMDLTEVEGLADLINAETEAQRKQALRQAGGALTKLYDRWRDVLIRCVAHVEAVIDFGEDEALEDETWDHARMKIKELTDEVTQHLADGRRGERVRDGLRVAIIGPPNAGKSSLINVLSQRQAAIVSDIPGTTRDVIEVSMDLGGFPVLLADTAGMRERSEADAIEREGIDRARNVSEMSDVRICVVDASLSTDVSIKKLEAGFGDLLQGEVPKTTLLVLNKSEIDSKDKSCNAFELANILGVPNCQVHSLSCRTGFGVDVFVKSLETITKSLCDTTGSAAGETVLTQARHRGHLTRCHASLVEFFELTANSQDCDAAVAAHYLRQAAFELGSITGRMAIEDVLDVIFSDFCIGK